jgi:hypothetical protein
LQRVSGTLLGRVGKSHAWICSGLTAKLAEFGELTFMSGPTRKGGFPGPHDLYK